MGTHIAEKCFQENINLFVGHPSQNPKEYNLYNGLLCLAEAIRELQNQVSSLQGQVSRMARK